MIRLGVRSQLLYTALAPAILVATVLSIVFLYGRVTDLWQAHRERSEALARQLATSAEFALFAGNRQVLQGLANAALRERDVTAVTIVDRDGTVVARAGRAQVALPTGRPQLVAPRLIVQGAQYLVLQAVVPAELQGDPLFEGAPAVSGHQPGPLGLVALETSRVNVQRLERNLMLLGMLVTVAGLLFGSVLAFRLSRGFSRPLLALTQTVERVGSGELHSRVAVSEASPLHGLAEGVNRMAIRLEQARDELERRVTEATAELRVKKDEAEQANVAKSRFVAAASHDLRQPMHALGLFVDSLRDEVASQPRARRLVEGIRNSIDAMTAMFDALLDISRLDAGVITVARANFPVSAVLRQLETMFTPLALERGLRFSVVATRAWARSDPVLLERLLQNLVANALTHTRSGGVLLGCRRRRGALSIEVWDTGPGIAAEHQRDIFKEFFQLGNPERDRRKGLGLGLAIVERIARVLNHPLQLRSSPGRGSVFAVEVPLADAGADHAAPVQLDLVTDRFAGECVALIDDDAASLEAMTSLLEGWQLEVVAADSEAALLRRLAQRGVLPQVMICDYRLREGRNGIQAIERVRAELGCAIPAVLVTGDTALDRLMEAHASGLELLHKPVAPARLREALRVLLASARPDGAGAARR